MNRDAAMPTPTYSSRTTRHLTVALVGNPNTGKTTVFNALTGFHLRVGNYPGITVEKRTGPLAGTATPKPIEILDLPGTYSLTVQPAADDGLTLDVLLGYQQQTSCPDIIICVVDASNLRRNLFLASQTLELGCPVVVALTMIDIAREKRLEIDTAALSGEMGVPVIPIVATKGEGIKELKRAIVDAADTSTPTHRPTFPDCVSAELEGLTASTCLPDNNAGDGFIRPSRVELLQTLLNPGGVCERRLARQSTGGLSAELDERRGRIESAGESLAQVEAHVRYAWIDEALTRAVGRSTQAGDSRSDLVDKVLTHRVWGIAVLVLLMGVVFQSIYAWAAPLMDLVDALFGWLGGAIDSAVPSGAVQSLLVDGVLAGVGAVLMFLPQIVILFLFMAVLEDCGYLARAAFLLDRYMRRCGLSGKSFVPMLSSFACAVPGIMATRSIEDRRDRLVTIIVAPLMSCSARLPIYVLLISVFVPSTALFGGLFGLQALTMLSMYLVGVLVAVAMAFALKRTLVRGRSLPFILELPAYRWPGVKTVLYRAYEAGKKFVRTAGTVIFAASIIIWAMAYYPRPAAVAVSFEAKRSAADEEYRTQIAAIAEAGPAGNAANARLLAARARSRQMEAIDRNEAGAYLRQSVLGRMGHWIEPLVKPMGWDWRIGTAVIASFPAREVVVATLATIYNLGGEASEDLGALRSGIQNASWPDGRPVFNLAVAISIMVFFALSCQCVSTLAVIRRETNTWRWPVFTFAYMTTLAYVGALATYHVVIRLV